MPLAGQGGQLVAGQGNFFVEAVELTVGFRQRRFGLADFEMGADTGIQATLGQGQDLLLLFQFGLDDIALGKMQAQLDVGTHHIVLQFQLRLTVKDRIISTYRTIVGKPGRTATPQLAEMVEGVVFNPTWTVPQSIVKGEGLGARALGNPAWARRNGYVATRGANGYITVVQQPGPGNSLGQMKLVMPNPYSVFMHDTPNKSLFNEDYRFDSSGCVRVQNVRDYIYWILQDNPQWTREAIDAAGQAIEDAGLTEMTEEERFRAGCSIGSGIGGQGRRSSSSMPSSSAPLPAWALTIASSAEPGRTLEQFWQERKCLATWE